MTLTAQQYHYRMDGSGTTLCNQKVLFDTDAIGSWEHCSTCVKTMSLMEVVDLRRQVRELTAEVERLKTGV